MKKLTCAFAAITVIACNTPPAGKQDKQTAAATAEQTSVFPWLQGKWMIDYGETKVYENWKQETGTLLKGNACVVEGKDTVMTEVLQIEQVAGRWVFIAQVNDNPPVLFTAKQDEHAQELVFENPEHDFPQQVIYGTGKDGELYATVQGKEKGKEKKEEFRYKRME